MTYCSFLPSFSSPPSNTSMELMPGTSPTMTSSTKSWFCSPILTMRDRSRLWLMVCTLSPSFNCLGFLAEFSFSQWKHPWHTNKHRTSVFYKCMRGIISPGYFSFVNVDDGVCVAFRFEAGSEKSVVHLLEEEWQEGSEGGSAGWFSSRDVCLPSWRGAVKSLRTLWTIVRCAAWHFCPRISELLTINWYPGKYSLLLFNTTERMLTPS